MNIPLAFPLPYNDQTGAQFGMTLRDYFAAAALTGLAANPEYVRQIVSNVASYNQDPTAGWAFKLADEMLKERGTI